MAHGRRQDGTKPGGLGYGWRRGGKALAPLFSLGLVGAECPPEDDDDSVAACEEHAVSPYTARPSWFVWPDVAPESILDGTRG